MTYYKIKQKNTVRMNKFHRTITNLLHLWGTAGISFEDDSTSIRE